MKSKFTHYFSLAFLFLLVGLYTKTSIAQTGVLNPNDPIVVYDATHPPVTPPGGTLVKWVKTNRLGWNTSSLKAYYYNGIPFRLKFPKSYSTAADGKTYPLYLFFHGVGEGGSMYDNEYSMYHGGDVLSAAVDNGKFDGFLLYPQSTNASGAFSTAQLSVIYNLIMNYLIPQVKVDPNRIIVNGLSGGGGATWEFTETYPKMVAASIPMSAATTNDVNKIGTLIYKPIWLSSGALDDAPSPYTCGLVSNAATANGCDFVWKLYSTLGHNVWDSVWKEPDFFPYMNRAYMSNPWTKFGRTEFCPGDAINVTVGVTGGFNGYEWRKDGVTIPGANSSTIIVTQLGTYDCRILNGSTWSIWSPIPVVIKVKQPTVTPDIQVSGLASNVLPAPDGSTTVTLQVPAGYVNYVWQKLNPVTALSNNTNILSGATVGSYQVKVTEQYGCSSSFSNLFTVIDANGPNQPSLPANLQATAVSQTQIKLNWTEDAAPANPETQFEVYQSVSSSGPYKLIGFSPALADSFLVSGLNAKTRYYYKIRAINNTAASAATLPASSLTPSDITPPTAPNNLHTGNISTNSVELLWDSAKDDVGVTNYDIYVNGKLSYTVGNLNDFTVYNLVNGQIYTFIVKARDLSGNVSLPSNQAVSAAAFTGLNFKYYTFSGTWNQLPDFGTLSPTGTGNVPNITIVNRSQDINYAFLWEGYIQIPVNGTYTFRTNSDDGSNLYLGSLNQTGSPYSFTATPLVNNDGLHGTQNKNGTITLTAGVYPIAISFYQQGGGQSIAVSWSTPQTHGQFVTVPDSVFAQKVTFPGSAPVAPSKLVAVTASAKKINLTWQDNSSNESGFEIYRSTSATGNYAIVASTAANSTSYGDSTCSPSTTYYYKIKAIGQYGSSKYSGQDSSALNYGFYGNYTSGTLSALSTLTPSSMGVSNNFTLGVTTATSNFALIFDGYINIKAAGSYTFYTSSDDGSTLYIDGTAAGNLVVNNDGLHGTQEKSGTIFLSAGRHKIRVNFFQQGGGQVLTVSYASTTNRITKTIIPDSVLSVIPANATTQGLPALPAVPSSLTGTAQGPNKINLNWTSNGTPIITGFELWRSPANNANYALLTTAPGNATAFIDSGLTANTVYYYKLRAVNEAGNSDYGNEINITTIANPASVVTLNVINNQSIYNDTTVNISLAASTDLGSGIVFSASGLPAFGTLITNSDGTGTLTLKPGGLDLGNYFVTVTATDNYGNTNSKSFTITIAGKNQTTIGINFNAQYAQASPWNNTNSVPSAGLTVSNLKDMNGNVTGAGFNLVGAWNGYNSLGPTTGNNSGPVPDNVLRTVYYSNSNTPLQFRVTGLSSAKKYSIVFISSYPWSAAEEAASGKVISNFTIGAQTATINAANNVTNTVQINGISPDGSGNILVTVSRGTGSTFVLLNAIEVLSYTSASDSLKAPYNLSANGISASKIKLSWQATSDMRTSFQIWRSTSSDGTYSLLDSVAGNVTNYTDSNLTANTTFFYKVRAVNNIQYSAFSSYAGGSTVAYVVNLNLNTGPSDAENSGTWNNLNLNELLYEGFTLPNLANTKGLGTGINFVQGAPFDGVTSVYGTTTGNNSGAVPDIVMKTSYYISFGVTAKFTITGLNLTNIYNFVFFGSDTYNNTGTTIYQIGAQAATLNTLNNKMNTATLYGIKPDSTGSVTVSVYTTNGFGFINSLTLQAMISPDYADSNGAGGGGNAINANAVTTGTSTLEAGITSENAADKLTGFPNPFKEDITLRFGLKQNVAKFTVSVADMGGRIVYRKEFYNAQAGTWEQRIGMNGSSLNTGVYIVQILGIPGESPKTLKLIKVR